MWESSYHRNNVIVAESIKQVQPCEEQAKAFSIIIIDLPQDPGTPLMGIATKPYFSIKGRQKYEQSMVSLPNGKRLLNFLSHSCH